MKTREGLLGFLLLSIFSIPPVPAWSQAQNDQQQLERWQRMSPEV